jgi:hypothetical protein
MTPAPVQVVFVPVPIFVAQRSRRGQDRDRNWRPPRERNVNVWPLTPQPIPQPDRQAVRALVERARRTLAEERERRAWRDLT